MPYWLAEVITALIFLAVIGLVIGGIIGLIRLGTEKITALTGAIFSFMGIIGVVLGVVDLGIHIIRWSSQDVEVGVEVLVGGLFFFLAGAWVFHHYWR